MTNQLARARQHSVRVGKLSATIKTKIHVVAVGYDVAKPSLSGLPVKENQIATA
jgi:hypothetical protein